MSNPVKSADDIDWDKIAKRLGKAFDKAMASIEGDDYYDESCDAALMSANKTVETLIKITAERRAQKATRPFKLDKS